MSSSGSWECSIVSGDNLDAGDHDEISQSVGEVCEPRSRGEQRRESADRSKYPPKPKHIHKQ